MDQAVTQLLTMETVYLSVAVVIVTFFARRIVETAMPSVKKAADENSPNPTYLTGFSRWWNGVILYAMPVVSGAAIAMGASAAEWSEMLPKTWGAAAMYGSIVGWFSSFLYKVFRKVLKARTGVDPIPGPASVVPSEAPPPPSDEESASS